MDLRARLRSRWRAVTGQEWRDEAQLAYEVTALSLSRFLSLSPESLALSLLPSALSCYHLWQAQIKASDTQRRTAPVPPPPRPHTSMVTDLFGGELLSAVTCCGCGQVKAP